MAYGNSLEAQIELQMMELGSGVITDLDRFMLPRIEDCDIDGNELGSETDYFGGSRYDYEPHI
jgi:hypothetical protein